MRNREVFVESVASSGGLPVVSCSAFSAALLCAAFSLFIAVFLGSLLLALSAVGQ